MLDESEPGAAGCPRRGLLATVLAAATLLGLAAAPAAAAPTPQSLRGFAQVQYESQDQRGGLADDVQWWTRTLQVDYTTRLKDELNVAAQGVWSDLSYIDRPDRRTQPRGSIRLAHRFFGASASYRPLRTTDALGVTVRQRETLFSGYLLRPGWPSVTGTWIRRHQLENVGGPAATGVTRSVQANHQLGPLNVRGSWGDQIRFVGEDQVRTFTQTNFGGGGTFAVTRGSANAALQYDFQGVQSGAPGAVLQRTGIHAAQGSAMNRFSKRFDAAASYVYHRTIVRNNVRTDLDEHEGALLGNWRMTQALRLTSGGGLRTARLESRQRTERYVLATAAAEGAIRRGMTGVAAVTRSYNWFPGETPHPVDAYHAGGRVRLARGLDANADAQVTASRSRAAIADTAGGPTRVTAQSGFGFVAVPLQPISVAFSWREYRTGASLFDPSARARSSTWETRWNPSTALSLNATLGRSRGLGASEPVVTTATANAAWRPRASLDLSGSYTRSDRVRFDPTSGISVGREVYGARLLASIATDWRVQVAATDADPGRPSHVRQWDLSLTKAFRR
ncbi:MAG TPA: hypothetical protein VF363_00380 [Candidatus Eisenbacteria bacterium]